MVHIEGLVKLLLHFILSAFPSFDVWVIARWEIFLDVIYLELSLSLKVDVFVGFNNYLGSVLAQLAFYHVDELFIVNHTIFIGVKRIKNTFDIFGVYFESEVLDCFIELKHVERSWVI